MIWEKIAHCEIVRKGEVICTGFSTKQGFRINVIATEELYIKNVEISNRIYIQNSPEMLQINSLRREIQDLKKENKEMANEIMNLQYEN